MVNLERQIMVEVLKNLDSDAAKQIIETATQKKLEDWGIAPQSTVLEVKYKGKTERIEGSHFLFPTILKCVSAKTPIALVGPAGSGKTSAVKQSAKSLDLPFYSKSVSIQTGTHEFFGYMDATGNYISTLFRDAYEKGGVFLLDEFDAGNPNVLAALNQATANDECPFPDKMISKHEDFVIVMAGNTFGTGATMEYVGRNKIDAATLDRFVFLEFPYDELLEQTIATNQSWCKRVQKFRKRAEEKKVKTIISPRATFLGEKLLEQGIDQDQVEKMIIFKGLNEQEVELLQLREEREQREYGCNVSSPGFSVHDVGDMAEGLRRAMEDIPQNPDWHPSYRSKSRF